MDPKTLNLVNRAATFLGWFSVGLGTLETVAPAALGRTLGLDNHTALLRAYGVRELSAGAGLLTLTNTPLLLWSRVAGDVMDIATLALALGPGNRKRGNAQAALAAVLGITGLDLWTAVQFTRHQAASVHPHAQRVGQAAAQ